MRFYLECKMISVQVTAPTVKDDLRPAINKSLWQSSLLVRSDAVKLSPYKTGTLRRSITEKVYDDKAIVWTNVIYARIHELWWEIKPKTKPYLIFKVWWRFVKTKRVIIKARPYLWPALEKNQDKITKIFSDNINDLLLQ